MTAQSNTPRARPTWQLAGVAIAVTIGLAATAHPVFSPRILQHYADSPDSVDITRWAERATTGDLRVWWSGPWIQRTSPYYRPLSSIAFWLEYRAFGWNFQGHVLVSWILHGWVCACVYWLAWGLFGGGARERTVLALIATALFNARLGPEGPGWMTAPVAYGVVAWWPAQTDQLCLAFSLPALLLVDRWLRRARRRDLAGAAALWIIALLFKEMAVVVPVLAGCLALCRRGVGSIRLRGPEGVGAFWKLVIPGLALAAAFLALRSFLVPGAWGPKAHGLGYFVGRAIWHAAARPQALVISRGPWLAAVAVFVAACIYIYARLPKRPGAVWLIVALVVGSGALAQLVGGNFALITIPEELAGIAICVLPILGAVTLLHVRGGPTWPLVAMVAVVYAPILHVQGPHYLYWPAVFWALLDASLLMYVWGRHRAGTLQWSARGDATRGVRKTRQDT